MPSVKGKFSRNRGGGPSNPGRSTGISRCSGFLDDFQMPLLDAKRRMKFSRVVDQHLSSRSASGTARVLEQLVTEIGQNRLMEVFSHRAADSLSDRVSDWKLEEEHNMAVMNLLAHPVVAQSVVASKIYTAFSQFAVKFFTQVFECFRSELENHPEFFDSSSGFRTGNMTSDRLRFVKNILLGYQAFYEVLYRVPGIVRHDVEASLKLVDLMIKPHEEIVAWSRVECLGLSKLMKLRYFLVSATSLLTKIQHIAEEIQGQALMGEAVKRKPQRSRAEGEIPARSGPGSLSLDKAPRHDNDFQDYKQISVLPTEKEIYSELQDFLPRDGCEGKAFCEPQNFLPHGTLRLFDKHFRCGMIF
mmetsp:Transcript_33123/g.130240  ORF Transcript_33123/g.130240 Transcript_33123/m.130240 type:complete len:359 (-) Transcript_33123:7788-8864(-)